MGIELQAAGLVDVKLNDRMPEKLHPSFANVIFLGNESLLDFAELPSKGDEQFALRKYEHEGTRYWVIVSGTPRGQYYGFMEFLDGKDNAEDGPHFELRGVVEGFYGPPWSWEDRAGVLEFMSGVRMNMYIYAPKDDPYHRDRWRELYDDRTISHFSSLVQQAKARFIEFCYALSPGLSVDYGSDSDLDVVVEKLKQLYQIGVRAFALFLDDIPERLQTDNDKARFSSLGEAQREFLTRLQGRLRAIDEEVRLLFCPTEYHGVEATDYHVEISKLDGKIEVFWTGPQICSKEIRSADAEKMMNAFGRRLLIWDNYPVNDYDRRRLYINAVRNRDPDLCKSCAGVFTNPMSEVEASKVAILTYAEYLWNPEVYDPDRSLERALAYIFGPESLPLARTLVTSLVDFFFDEDSDRNQWLVDALREGDGIEIERALTRFGEMSSTSELLTSLENEKLVEELRSHVERLSELGTIGELHLQRLLLCRKVGRNPAKVLPEKLVRALCG